MHNSSFDSDSRECKRDGGDVLVAIAALVTEGRIPGKVNKAGGFHEGPHCPPGKQSSTGHSCNPFDSLCQKYESVQKQILNLWKKNIPVCVEVLLIPNCHCNNDQQNDQAADTVPSGALLLEQWHLSITQHRTSELTTPFNINQLIGAVRSQLYFSQISAWLSTQEELPVKLSSANFRYRLAIPGETYGMSTFNVSVPKHNFPSTELGNGFTLNVTLMSLPRMQTFPSLLCSKCVPIQPKTAPPPPLQQKRETDLLDDRMHTVCTLKGKHRCEDLDDLEQGSKKECKFVKRSNAEQQQQPPPPQPSGEPSTSGRQPNQTRLSVDATTTTKSYYYQFKENKKNYENCKNEKRSSMQDKSTTKAPKLDLDEIKDALIAFDKNDLSKRQGADGDGGDDTLLDAVLRSSRLQCDTPASQRNGSTNSCRDRADDKRWKERRARGELDFSQSDTCDINQCERGDIFNYNERVNNIYVGSSNCDNTELYYKCNKDVVANFPRPYKGKVKQRLNFDNFPNNRFGIEDLGDKKENGGRERVLNGIDVPSSAEKANFRKSLDNAASMVFHSRTGLPLTSSPAPVRKGKCFDFDSSINSVSAIKSALYADNFYTDEDSESDGSIVSPKSPESYTVPKFVPPVKYHRKRHSSNLLGSFEESVLNGRLEPVSTVHGFKAELGASGSFIPNHVTLPVTVFFYTLGDNDKISSPYLGHINLGKKGYNVPSQGTLQITLYNPSGTVVKMFVVMYDLGDMPPNSKTFIRQRTLNIPNNCRNTDLELSPKWLRYLIHLRFMSSKSGRIYLHSDIRIVISRKSDMDTATGHGDSNYELRSFTHMPTNPKYTSVK